MERKSNNGKKMRKNREIEKGNNNKYNNIHTNLDKIV